MIFELQLVVLNISINDFLKSGKTSLFPSLIYAEYDDHDEIIPIKILIDIIV